MIKEFFNGDIKLIELKKYSDERGFFVVRYDDNISNIIKKQFVQDNHSRSKAGVIRGLHYQHDPSQGKLIGVIKGKIFDAVVDIRSTSKTYGQYASFILDEHQLLWISDGFAHGFCTIEESDVVYKVTELYNPKTEESIKYDDQELNIQWPCKSPIVSNKDMLAKSFATYKTNPRY